jgi:nucleoid DNA-binding protein
MDELIKVLIEKAGLSEAQAKAVTKEIVEWLKHEDNRKTILAAASATIASAVAVRAI